jgi:hypothetical protein
MVKNNHFKRRKRSGTANSLNSKTMMIILASGYT